MKARVSEPQPGRTLVETGEDVETTFTIEPTRVRHRVRFDTTIEAGGVEGLLTRLFVGRLLRPIYADELRRLEDHTRVHPPLIAS